MNILLILILVYQFASGLSNLRLGVGVFVTVFVVFPSTVPFLSFFDLNFVRTSIVIATLNLIIYNYNKRKLTIVGGSTRYFNSILIFSCFLLPSFLFAQFSEGVFRGLYLFFNYYFLEQFLPGIILLFAIREEKDFIFFLKCIAFAVIIMGVYGVYEFYTNNNPFQNWVKTVSVNETIEFADESRLGFSRRAQSTAWHPIAYGGYLSMYIIMFAITMISGYRERKLKKIKQFLYFVVFLALINIALTASRTPWVSTAVSLFFLFLYNFRQLLMRNFQWKILLAFLLVPGFIYVGYQTAIFLLKADYNGSSFEMRIGQFNYIVSNLKDAFLIGFGPTAMEEFFKTGQFGDALGFESIIFVFLADYGILGLTGLIVLYYSTIKSFKVKTYYSGFFYAIILSHVIFVLLSGEIRTFRVFWLLYSMLYAAHHIELKKERLKLITK